MFSARTLARSAPRALSRMTTVQSAAIVRPSHSILLRSMPIRSSQMSAFSTSLLRKAAASQVDGELSQKLASEIEFEANMKEHEPTPVSIKDFLDNSPFEIKDTPGMQDVTLKRTYGSEKITVSFSIADIANMENSMSEEDDYALGDEEVDGQGRSSQEGGEEDGEAGAGGDSAMSMNLNIVIEKPGKGCINLDAVAQDSAIIVENMSYYQDPAIAHSSSPEAVHKSRDVYPGPPFGTLDEDLQLLMEQYLEERGINNALAVFVPDYMDYKEQREYLQWLNNVKGFVDA